MQRYKDEFFKAVEQVVGLAIALKQAKAARYGERINRPVPVTR
jgi:hypothetical protein